VQCVRYLFGRLGGLELGEELRHRFRGRLLEVMHQHNAFAVLLQLRHDRLHHLFGLAHLEVERVHVRGDDRNVAFAEVGDHFGRVLQSRKAEERRHRSAFERPMHGADALFNFGLGVLWIFYLG